ncbi:hypothetical protein RSOLAG22IIIB_12306 [Rhizoctonia solani]|uniref:Ubiquitin-like domain-containing protein n=1 Tax=Rhizoctonia solani TaxID=456999 RepID=A0A0K6GCZ7_9AGAM|nr:hypothetical protein RSOLAG22IIIB_12306 [Rhizoctonia solani]
MEISASPQPVLAVETADFTLINDVHRDTKVKEVKQLYESKAGRYPEILIYNLQELQDVRTLGYYNIRDESIIEAEELS